MITYTKKNKLLYIYNDKIFCNVSKYFMCDMFFHPDTKAFSFEINNQNMYRMIYVIIEMKNKNKINMTYNVLFNSSYLIPDNYISMNEFEKELSHFSDACDKVYNKNLPKDIEKLKKYMNDKTYLKYYDYLCNMNEQQLELYVLKQSGL